MTKRRLRPRDRQFLMLALVPMYFIVAAFFLQPVDEILPGVITLVREPDFLITESTFFSLVKVTLLLFIVI